ncbi:MAG: M20/M25/M40 family metallo-hydrolase [Actinobacteria bacterium]|nr:M20/M25/M40 family metallo-hydrolase [Actinomycetota bacterium]
MAVVTALAGDIGPRAAGTPGDEAARRYVVAALRTAGWSVREEVVPLPQGGTTANVVARLPGASLGRPHVVVGAHLDTVAGTPGANDNATGVGVLVALAEELADEQPVLRHPVVLVAFGAEEYQPSEPRRHHLGSQAYADLRADVVVEMLGVDMVGNGPTTCLCWLRGTDDELARRLAEVADAEGLSVRAEARGDISDHGPFAHAGVPAAFLWTFDDGVLHTPADTSDRIRAEDLDRAGRLVLAWLRSR